MTEKFALVVTSQSLVNLGALPVATTRVPAAINPLLWQVRPHMVSRNTCELDSTLQQLIPYCVLLNEYGEVFVYGRGDQGGEGRLIGKLSLGLGGHVDSLPPEGTTLMAHLYNEAARELEEEAQIKNADLRFCGVIKDFENDGKEVPVGHVHYGILAVAKIKTTDIGNLEEGIIVKGQWMNLEDLKANHSRFETWSQIVINGICDGVISA